MLAAEQSDDDSRPAPKKPKTRARKVSDLDSEEEGLDDALGAAPAGSDIEADGEFLNVYHASVCIFVIFHNLDDVPDPSGVTDGQDIALDENDDENGVCLLFFLSAPCSLSIAD